MRSDPWHYGGQPVCGCCGWTEHSTRMLNPFREDRLCDPCFGELARCGLCGDGRVGLGEQMCDECKGQDYED